MAAKDSCTEYIINTASVFLNITTELEKKNSTSQALNEFLSNPNQFVLYCALGQDKALKFFLQVGYFIYEGCPISFEIRIYVSTVNLLNFYICVLGLL